MVGETLAHTVIFCIENMVEPLANFLLTDKTDTHCKIVYFHQELDYLYFFSIIFIFCFFMDRLLALAKWIFQNIHKNFHEICQL